MTSESMQSAVGRLKMPERTPEEWAQIERDCAEWEASRKRGKQQGRVIASGIPKRFRDARLKDGEAFDWVLNPSDGLILTGSIGVGKTYAACAALKTFMYLNDCSGRFITAAEYVQECRNFDGSEDKYQGCGILVLDDLGKEAPTQFAIECIFELIDSRHSSRKPTIITTNYGSTDLMERMTAGDDTTVATAIMSRLAGFTVVQMQGVDRRL